MGEKTGIGWTDSTWNPWMGCHKVSQGCKFCYMFREQERYGNDPNLVRRSKTKFAEPLKWTDPRRIFTCSWSDWFIEEADEWRAEAWDIIRRTPQHTYQILTKRPGRIIANLPVDWGIGYPNVWLGVTAEDQANADKRISQLLQIPAAVRFISIEPMIEPVDMRDFQPFRSKIYSGYKKVRGILAGHIDWLICGCESGHNARPMNIDWARDLRDQCVAAGVPFFLKQMVVDGKLTKEPYLDGRQWLEFPEEAHHA